MKGPTLQKKQKPTDGLRKLASVRFNTVFYPAKGRQNPNESALNTVDNQRQLELII